MNYILLHGCVYQVGGEAYHRQAHNREREGLDAHIQKKTARVHTSNTLRTRLPMAAHVINQKGLKKKREKKFINNHTYIQVS